MSRAFELGVGAFPDRGEMGPEDRHFTHPQCGSKFLIQPQCITGDHTLRCPGCGLLITVSDAAMHRIDIAAILQRSGLAYSESPGGETDLIVIVVPLG